jgi:hypothetical protein
MEYLFAINLIAHSPIYRFRWFAFDPALVDTLIQRRNEKIALCAQRIDEKRAYDNCLEPSNEGERVNVRRCVHPNKSTGHHNTVIRNAEVEIDYLSGKINRMGSVIEPFKRSEFGY